jgi:phosphomannomutase/phosphoglucomutase
VKLPQEIFRAYDIRGIVGSTLTPDIVRSIGRALGTLGLERGASRFALARDGRLSGPELATALADGINEAGADVIDIGMAPTPVAYFAAHHLGSQSAVVVTGSHNPPEYNGVKMVVGGTTLSGDEIQALRARIERGDLAKGSGQRSASDVLDAYVDRIAGDVKLSRRFKIAIDCGNGVTGVIAQRLYERLGCDVIGLYTKSTGVFRTTIRILRSRRTSRSSPRRCARPTPSSGWRSTATATGSAS